MPVTKCSKTEWRDGSTTIIIEDSPGRWQIADWVRLDLKGLIRLRDTLAAIIQEECRQNALDALGVPNASVDGSPKEVGTASR